MKLCQYIYLLLFLGTLQWQVQAQNKYLFKGKIELLDQAKNVAELAKLEKAAIASSKAQGEAKKLYDAAKGTNDIAKAAWEAKDAAFKVLQTAYDKCIKDKADKCLLKSPKTTDVTDYDKTKSAYFDTSKVAFDKEDKDYLTAQKLTLLDDRAKTDQSTLVALEATLNKIYNDEYKVAKDAWTLEDKKTAPAVKDINKKITMLVSEQKWLKTEKEGIAAEEIQVMEYEKKDLDLVYDELKAKSDKTTETSSKADAAHETAFQKTQASKVTHSGALDVQKVAQEKYNKAKTLLSTRDDELTKCSSVQGKDCSAEELAKKNAQTAADLEKGTLDAAVKDSEAKDVLKKTAITEEAAALKLKNDDKALNDAALAKTAAQKKLSDDVQTKIDNKKAKDTEENTIIDLLNVKNNEDVKMADCKARQDAQTTADKVKNGALSCSAIQQNVFTKTGAWAQKVYEDKLAKYQTCKKLRPIKLDKNLCTTEYNNYKESRTTKNKNTTEKQKYDLAASEKSSKETYETDKALYDKCVKDQTALAKTDQIYRNKADETDVKRILCKTEEKKVNLDPTGSKVLYDAKIIYVAKKTEKNTLDNFKVLRSGDTWQYLQICYDQQQVDCSKEYVDDKTVRNDILVAHKVVELKVSKEKLDAKQKEVDDQAKVHSACEVAYAKDPREAPCKTEAEKKVVDDSKRQLAKENALAKKTYDTELKSLDLSIAETKKAEALEVYNKCINTQHQKADCEEEGKEYNEMGGGLILLQDQQQRQALTDEKEEIKTATAAKEEGFVSWNGCRASLATEKAAKNNPNLNCDKEKEIYKQALKDEETARAALKETVCLTRGSQGKKGVKPGGIVAVKDTHNHPDDPVSIGDKTKLKEQYIGQSCTNNFDLCSNLYGAKAAGTDSKGKPTLAQKSTNPKGLCCGTAQVPEDAIPDGWDGDNRQEFIDRFNMTKVCNWYMGDDSKEVDINWIPISNSEPEGCKNTASGVRFNKFRCLPQYANKIFAQIAAILAVLGVLYSI